MSDISNITQTSSFLRRALFAGSFALFGAVGTVGIQAAAGGPGGPGMRGGHAGALIQHVLEDVDLNDDQKASLEALRDDMRAERSTMREEHAADLDRIGELVTADQIDRAAVHELLDRRAAEKVEMVHEVADRLMDFHGTLSADQKAQLGENVTDVKSRMESRRGGFDADDDDFQGRRGRSRR